MHYYDNIINNIGIHTLFHHNYYAYHWTVTAPYNTPSDIGTPNTSHSDKSFLEDLDEFSPDFSPSVIIETLEKNSSDAKGKSMHAVANHHCLLHQLSLKYCSILNFNSHVWCTFLGPRHYLH